MFDQVCCLSIGAFGNVFHTHVARSVYNQGEQPTHRPFVSYTFGLCAVTDLGINIAQMKENGLKVGITPANHS